MDKKENENLIPNLIPEMINKLLPFLKLPSGYCIHVENNINTVSHEAEVFIFKSESDKANAFPMDISMFGAVLNAVLINKGGERRLFLTVTKSIAPHWVDKNILNQNFKTVFSAYSNGYQKFDMNDEYLIQVFF